MADLNVWPTDGAGGSVSSEARWRRMARLWVPSGVEETVYGPTSLQPSLVAGPTINVAQGACWVDGHYAELTPGVGVPATANGLLVVRFTPADNRAELLYRDAVTVPTQTDATWELAIASMTAGAITDRRLRSRPGQHIAAPNYATLKLLHPAPADGTQAVTLDDGRTYTYRAAAFTYTPPGVAAPGGRWETYVMQSFSRTTDASGLVNITAADLGVDGIIHGVGHAGWDAAAPPGRNFGTFVRWTSAANLQFSSWKISATTSGTLTLNTSVVLTFTVHALCWRV